jgi:DNA ligase (NAD+)
LNRSLSAAGKRAVELRQQIELHRRRYYVDDDPDVSDAEYDALERELIKIEQAFPELKDVAQRIRVSLQADELQAIVKALREKAKIELTKP